jgi:predicted TIM-barrel fold metal-dependent hydrolase
VLSRRRFNEAMALAASSLSGKLQAADLAPVDCHTHVFVRGLTHAANARYVPDYDASYQELLAIAESNGVSRIVIEQPSFLGFDNSYLLGALKARPERFRGVPWIAPRTRAAQWDEMARLGVRGLRFPIFGLPTPDWADYKETFTEARRRDWLLDLYVECRRLPEILPAMLESGAKVIVPHFGMFDPRLGPRRDPGFKALLEAAKTGRVYVKLCGAYRVGLEGAREAAPLLLAAFGTSHLVWASDWPHTETDLDRRTTYPKTLQWLADWVPDEATRRKILVDTPNRLYGFS